ncbi:MAG: EVE domain-containing protein [Acidobacteria bacterium]|nr:EVE domain-containing protein [Acidobacteriota bacterium]
MSAKKRYWLVKSEPESYSLDDLERDGKTLWDGVRNYQARNFMRDDMKLGDGVLYYHSNEKPPAVVGLARVAREAYPDPSQFDPKSDYHDPKATPEAPRWVVVDIEFVERLARPVSLDEMKADSGLEGMLLLQRGQRLSVMPVEEKHFRRIVELGRRRN